MRRGGATVFTIAAGTPFLPCLVEALTSGSVIAGLEDPRLLAKALIYVPTRRAASALADALIAHYKGKAVLLPHIVPLGEPDGDLFDPLGLQHRPDLPPAIAPLERRLILARLVQVWADNLDKALLKLPEDAPLLIPGSPAGAVSLAKDLESLMDALTSENVPWETLGKAVEADYSHYFELTLKFVTLAAQNWPAILAERGASDPVQRRDALHLAQARYFDEAKPDMPVIAAGSTGSIAATASLLAAIAHLPHGAVVLPGLDQHLDTMSWNAIAGAKPSESVFSHPQALMRRLLQDHIGLDRTEVKPLGIDLMPARTQMMSEILRPAETTGLWALIPPEKRFSLAEQGCEGLSLIEAGDEREEALAVAIALRETLEQPSQTAALITPDRALAARVTMELARWNITIDDSAGLALSESMAGRLARLIAEAAAENFPPAKVLALLLHPDVHLGLTRREVEEGRQALEIGVLRGPATDHGLEGMSLALELRRQDQASYQTLPRKRLTAAQWELAALLLAKLKQAFQHFSLHAFDDTSSDLSTISALHADVIEVVTQGSDQKLDASFQALRQFFDELALIGSYSVKGQFTDYPDFFVRLAQERMIDPELRNPHPRLHILGTLEARLLSFDRVILGGLDEDIWPPHAQADAFLNRAMQARIGLMPPERRLGQSTHDFAQYMGAAEVMITRAIKRRQKPTVPSRFVQRLKAFTPELIWRGVIERGAYYVKLARHLETPPSQGSITRPAPCPDPALFPRRLSVTEIETLIRDPYAIYAKHILKLEPLEALAERPDAADRGTLIHLIMHRLTQRFGGSLPDDAAEVFKQLAQEALHPLEAAFPDLHGQWLRMVRRLADPVMAWERERRESFVKIYTEKAGQLILHPLKGEAFTLRARADRIETSPHSAALIDFKTGAVPSNPEIFAGFSPQLTLEAAILMRGGFQDIAANASCPELIYARMSGGRVPFVARTIAPPKGEARSVAALIDEHVICLEALLARYMKGEQAFFSRPFPKYFKDYSDYRHLARVKEWSLSEEDEDGSAISLGEGFNG
jgi:ATP-dependent helicase/nuclease subunit B